MKPPEIWAKCEICDPEYAGHPPQSVGWLPTMESWVCQECWYDLDIDERLIPLAYASDVILDQDEQMQRLIAAAAKRKLGVK